MSQNMFVSNRNIVVTSLKGHSIRFEKGKATYVPRAMHQEVIERGILPVDEGGSTDVSKIDEITNPAGVRVVVAPESQDERDDSIRQAIKAIVNRNRSEDFTAGGVPSSAAVSASLGWKVDIREIRPIWNAFKQEMNQE